MKIKPDTAIIRTQHVAQRLFEERMLVITPKNSMLHRFNEAGTFIWQLLEQPKTIDDICEEIRLRFDGVDDNRLKDEVRTFVEKLVEMKLVECRDEG